MSTASIRDILFDEAPSLTTSNPTALARIDRFIGRAANKIPDAPEWASRDEAIALLTWHNLLLSGLDGSGDEGRGQLLEEKMDNAAYKYANVPTDDSGYSTTAPGRRLKTLLDSRFVDPWIV